MALPHRRPPSRTVTDALREQGWAQQVTTAVADASRRGRTQRNDRPVHGLPADLEPTLLG
jgi:hypothetical protein